jgi:hypothetical protein
MADVDHTEKGHSSEAVCPCEDGKLSISEVAEALRRAGGGGGPHAAVQGPCATEIPEVAC